MLQIGHEAIHCFYEGVQTLVCQMGITGCCLGALMPQKFLNHPQVDAPLQQMRRIGMAQGMDRGLLTDSALEENDLEGLLQGGSTEGLTILLVWKETGTVQFPVLAQQLQQSLREGNTPVYAFLSK